MLFCLKIRLHRPYTENKPDRLYNILTSNIGCAKVDINQNDKDKSGNNNDLAQGTTANQPDYSVGNQEISFVATGASTDDVLSADSAIANATINIFTIYKSTDNEPYLQPLFLWITVQD